MNNSTDTRFRSLWILFVFAVSGCAVFSGTGKDHIRVKDYSVGCFHSDREEYAFVWKKGTYVCKNRIRNENQSSDPFSSPPISSPEGIADKILTSDELKEIREAIVRADRTPENLLKGFGITPESVAANRDRILTIALEKHWHLPEGGLPELPPHLENLLTYESIAPFLLNFLSGNELISTTHASFSAVLPGEPEIKIQSTNIQPGMLPFTVTMGEESWQIYDPHVANLLRKLTLSSSPNADRLNAEMFWKRDIWDGEWSMIWSQLIGIEADAVFSQQAYQTMVGFEKARKRFLVTSASSGNFYTQGLSILIFQTRK